METTASGSQPLFSGRHFDPSIIILCVRWYITYKLSYRDLRDMMAERGVDLAHTTIPDCVKTQTSAKTGDKNHSARLKNSLQVKYELLFLTCVLSEQFSHSLILRWVQRYVPEFEKKWNLYTRPVGLSWRVDETYIRVKGEWKYLYRAVDYQGNTVDFLLSEHRDIAAAKRFFTQAIEKHAAPEKITLDGYAASHTVVDELKKSAILPMNVCVRTSKYLNNLIEQDHRRVKQRVYSMLGFKRFGNAAITISGIELAHKIKKGQFDISGLEVGEEKVTQVWKAVLAA